MHKIEGEKQNLWSKRYKHNLGHGLNSNTQILGTIPSQPCL